MSETFKVNVWQDKVSANTLDDQRYWRLLDKLEQVQASRIKQPLLQHRYVDIHGRLRILLGQWLNESPDQLHISRTAQGKPYLDHYPELSFNLSHTGEHILFAIANQIQLGVDIEECKRLVNVEDLVGKCFAKQEQLYWSQLPASDQLQAFYRFWTMKEAFVKATGQGMTLELNACIINLEPHSEFLSVPEGFGRGSDWHIQSLACATCLSVAIVADKPFTLVISNGF